MKKHTEDRLEDAIEDQFINHDKYHQGASDDFDTDLAVEPTHVINFIQSTQIKTWQALENIHGADTSKVVVADLCKHLDTHGMLNVIRYGFKCYGKKLRMAYFLPNNNLNEDTLALYEKNRLSVTRQLYFSSKDKKSLDLVLFLNGLPIITMELKNPMTGQTVEDAKKQYKNDRDPNEPIFQFKRRCLVHFAVDPELVFMTTRLSKKKTVFLPFNLGVNDGAGNPVAADGGYRTTYLWREVLQSDSLMDILSRFIHLQSSENPVLKEGVIKKIKKRP